MILGQSKAFFQFQTFYLLQLRSNVALMQEVRFTKKERKKARKKERRKERKKERKKERFFLAPKEET